MHNNFNGSSIKSTCIRKSHSQKQLANFVCCHWLSEAVVTTQMCKPMISTELLKKQKLDCANVAVLLRPNLDLTLYTSVKQLKSHLPRFEYLTFKSRTGFIIFQV